MSKYSCIRGRALRPAVSLLVLAACFLSGCAGSQTLMPSPSPPALPTTPATVAPTQIPTTQNTPTASVPPSATPVVSSPGGLIAYVGPDNQLWLMQADGSDQRELTTGETVLSPAWSPDGQTLAYISRQEQSGQAFLYSPSSQQARPIGIIEDSNPHTVAWSADGLYLLVDSGASVISTATILDVSTSQVARQLQVELYAWSPDGHRLAFGQQHPLATPIPIESGNSIDLAVLDVAQGTIRVVLEGSSTVLYTPQGWLPDGRLLYDRLDWDPATQTGKDSQWTVTVDDTVGVPQPATNVPPQFDPAAVLARLPASLQGSVTGFFSWSPDGQWVLFQAGEGAQTAIYRFDWKHGGQPVRLADGSSAAWQPTGSPPLTPPSPTAIASGTASPSPTAIPTTASAILKRMSPPFWRHILFVHNHDGATELWTVDPAGGEARRQIRPEQTLQDPAVSPSGETIAYVRVTGNYGDVVSELWLMDRDGTNPRPLYVSPADRSVLKRPTWSPQGQEVYFLQLGDDRLLRIAAGGGEPTVVLTDCRDFSLSPDGQWLVAVDGDQQLAIFWPDGSRFRDVEPQGTVFTDYYSLAVSPDGDLLAFRATEEGGEDTWNLYVMDWSGRQVRRLTDLRGFHPATTSSGQVNGLAWTADGAHLVYSVDGHRKQSGVWLIGLDGGAPRRLWRNGEWAAVKGPWYEPGGAAGIAEEGPAQDDAQALLDDYSRALSSGEIAHPAFYSPAMQDLIPERRSYFDEFHQVALHSDLLGIGSRYELRSVTPDAVEGGLHRVRAVEVVTTTGRYRPPTAREYTRTRAALWAMARTDHPAVREALQEYVTQQTESADARFGDGESYETCWIVQHHLLVRQGQDGLTIIQDRFSDAANDNPTGSDVVDWANGQFVRHKPDLTLWPDYVMYHEPLAKIESLGRSMLANYTGRYGGTPPPDPHPTWPIYTSTGYGFSFRYPPGWHASEHHYPSDVQFPQDPDSPNFVWLYSGDGPAFVLRIGVRWPDEAAPIQRTGTGAGEIETQGSVPFLGRELSREVLVYDGKVKAVLYGNGQEIDVEGLILTLSLDTIGADYAAAEIRPEVQAEADEIVASFVLAAEIPPR